ncbi:hypothetical protein YC2023_061977 [Brassica napus]
MIVTSALIIWKALMCVTGTESPVVDVLSRSMEPAFKRGFHSSDTEIRSSKLTKRIEKKGERNSEIAGFVLEQKNKSITRRVKTGGFLTPRRYHKEDKFFQYQCPMMIACQA